jgi:hypothetical protein
VACGARDAADCLALHITPFVRDAKLSRDGLNLRGLAPCHDDTTRSLSVSVRKGRIVWNCFACTKLLGKEDAQRLTRKALIAARISEYCLPMAVRQASATIETVRQIVFGDEPKAGRKLLRLAALLEGLEELPAARLAIERAYLRGDTLEEIAKSAGVSVREADIYLSWWCDRGCPGAPAGG